MSATREKNGTWTAVVGVGKRGTPGSQRKKRGFRTKRAAEQWESDLRHAIGKGAYIPPSDRTVAELIDTDLETQVKLGRIRESTASGYRALLDRNVKPAIGHRKAQDLRAADLDRLYADLLANGRREATDRRGEGLASSTVRLVHSSLSGVFNRAVKRGDLQANPCQRATPPGASTDETPTWSLDELRTFLAHPEVRSHPDAVLWRLAAATGMRRGELLGLAWDDIDFDSATIDVRHNAVLVDGEVVIQAPKTEGSRRRVRIGDATVQVLRDHRARQREHRLAMGSGYEDHGLVFPRVEGTARNPIRVSHAFSKLVAKTGLRKVVLHSLRHAHASLLLDQGERIHDVASRLGHDAGVLLRRYAHSGRDAQDSAAALESLLDGDRPALRVVPGTDDEPDDCRSEPFAEGGTQ